MTAESRYWDHERCAWVAYHSTTPLPGARPADHDRVEASPEALADGLPEQRADAPTTAPTAGS